MGRVEGDEVEKMGDGADESEEGRGKGDEKTEELENNDENCPDEGAYTHNTGGLDWKDAGMVFRARVVIPTAADKHQATPA